MKLENYIPYMADLVSAGYSPEAAAGAIGSFHHEGMDEKNIKHKVYLPDGRLEIGCLGFTGSVADQYCKWCEQNALEWANMRNQFVYAAKVQFGQMMQYFKKTGIYIYFSEKHVYENCYTTMDAYKSASDVERAAVTFLANWWSPGLSQINNKALKWANPLTGKYELTFAERLKIEVSNRVGTAKEVLKLYKEKNMSTIISFPDYSQRKPQQCNMVVPGGTMTIYEGGCGAFPPANLSKTDPCKVIQYMFDHGYIWDQQGTTYAGETDTLNHFCGAAECITPGYVSGQTSGAWLDEADAWVDSGYCLSVLCGSQSKGCRTGCYGNHYITICGKDSNGRWLVHDSVDGYRTGYRHVRKPEGEFPLYGEIKKVWKVKVKWREDADKTDLAPQKDADNTRRAFFRQIQLGDKGKPEIYIAEECLKALGYYDGALDFDFGPKLKAAVLAFQKDKGLKQDAIIGPATWSELTGFKGAPYGATKWTVLMVEKERGETGKTVKFVQMILKARGFYNLKLDKSNGDGCQAGITLYKKARCFKDTKGTITKELLNDMCGGI